MYGRVRVGARVSPITKYFAETKLRESGERGVYYAEILAKRNTAGTKLIYSFICQNFSERNLSFVFTIQLNFFLEKYFISGGNPWISP
jgi:hypothetical protein